MFHFSFIERLAVCRGRGEQVAPAPFRSVAAPLDQPPFAIPTAWAYQRWQGSREIPSLAYLPQNSRGVDWSTTWNGHLRKIVFLAWLSIGFSNNRNCRR